MDVSSTNLTLPQAQNWTSISSCSYPYQQITFLLEIIFLILSFPVNIIVVMELLKRNCKRRNDRSASSTSSLSEAFLLHISLINIWHYVYVPMVVLNELNLFKVNYLFLYGLHSPSLTAVPLFLVAICVDCYVAVVHPVAYLAVKNLPHRVLLCTAPVWVYALVIWLISVIYQLSYFHPVCMLSFYVGLPAVVFFSISTLRALYSAKPGSSNQTLSPTKKRAFRIILSILVGMVVYYMPQVCFFTYRFIEPMDSGRLACLEIPLVMLLPLLCKTAVPLLCLYCVGKLGSTCCSIKT